MPGPFGVPAGGGVGFDNGIYSGNTAPNVHGSYVRDLKIGEATLPPRSLNSGSLTLDVSGTAKTVQHQVVKARLMGVTVEPARRGSSNWNATAKLTVANPSAPGVNPAKVEIGPYAFNVDLRSQPGVLTKLKVGAGVTADAVTQVWSGTASGARADTGGTFTAEVSLVREGKTGAEFDITVREIWHDGSCTHEGLWRGRNSDVPVLP